LAAADSNIAKDRLKIGRMQSSSWTGRCN